MNNNINGNTWDQFQSTPKLLPPTVFETSHNNQHSNVTNNNNNNSTTSNNLHTTIDNQSYENHSVSQFTLLSNELEKMKHEIKKVQSENENLRLKNKDFIEQAQLYTEVSSHRQISIKALEEIIHKQTREIQSLKTNLINEKEESSRKIKDNDAEWTRKQNETLTKLSEAEAERHKAIDTYEKSLAKLRNEHDLSNKNQADKIQNLVDENRVLTEKHEKEVVTLKNTIENLQIEKVKDTSEKDIQNNLLQSENAKLQNELQNLKNYVNNSMPTIETVKEMTREKGTFDSEIAKIKARNDSLVKENNAIQIRLKSMNEVLTIQENQLESKQATGSTGAIYNEKKRQGLLNRWRNKVYELLIQLKSLEINSKKDKNLAEKTLENYLERLEDAINKNKIFENLIEDKKAEISVISADNTLLTNQVTSLKETNEHLEKRNKMDLQSSMELKSFVTTLVQQYQTIEESFRLANKKLAHLDQRVEFARNRLGVVKALYSRKEMQEIRRANVLEMTTNLSTIYGSIDPNESQFNPPISLEHQHGNEMKNVTPPAKMDSDEEKILRKELEMVVEERDLLATKLQSDAVEMDEKNRKLRVDYEANLAKLEEQIGALRELSNEKEERLLEISEQLLLKKEQCEVMTKRQEELQKELMELREQLSLDYEKQLKMKDLDFGEKLAKMDEKLNEARREQAKAVVMMRQMERSTNREKDRMENSLKSCDIYYKDRVTKLQNKVISLEKERNVLMNSLRQNGNLSTKDFERLVDNKADTMKATNSPNLNRLNGEAKSFSLNSEMTQNNDETTEVTSFWLESNQNLREDEGDDEEYVDARNDKENYTEEFDESDAHKDSEILQQIRKIMGNLELSDIEDETDNKDEKNSQLNFLDQSENYSYETEHVIDEESVFKRTNDSFSN